MPSVQPGAVRRSDLHWRSLNFIILLTMYVWTKRCRFHQASGWGGGRGRTAAGGRCVDIDARRTAACWEPAGTAPKLVLNTQPPLHEIYWRRAAAITSRRGGGTPATGAGVTPAAGRDSLRCCRAGASDGWAGADLRPSKRCRGSTSSFRLTVSKDAEDCIAGQLTHLVPA